VETVVSVLIFLGQTVLVCLVLSYNAGLWSHLKEYAQRNPNFK